MTDTIYTSTASLLTNDSLFGEICLPSSVPVWDPTDGSWTNWEQDLEDIQLDFDVFNG